MAAFGAADQVAGQGKSSNLPNFPGQLFRLSPLETPLTSLIGGITGGEACDTIEFTWQDTLHRAPALQSVAEGADATFSNQKRNVRRNVVAIYQYGVETTYTKSAAVGLLGTSGVPPAIASPSILAPQPVQSEEAFQVQIKLEQAALDVELANLTGTYAFPVAGAARQSQGLVGWVDAATTTDWTAGPVGATKAVVNDIAQKLWANGAPMRNMVIFLNGVSKVELGNSYSEDASGSWNLAPRDRNVFGVNITDVVTEFGTFGLVLNRHLDAETLLFAELGVLSPMFMAIPGKGHFFLEPLAKNGSYDRMQLYGEIGLKLGPAGWHGKAINIRA
jgi:hypothetical protein